MATIRSQMVLNDGISNVLKKITAALDTTLDAFEQVQRASGQAIDADQIHAARRALVSANNAVDQMADNYRRAAQEENRLNQNISRGSAAADGMLSKISRIATTVAGIVGLRKIVGLSDQMTSTRARLALLADDSQVNRTLDSASIKAASTPDLNLNLSANASQALRTLDEVAAKATQVQDLGFYVTTDASQALSTLDEVSTKTTQVQDLGFYVTTDASQALSTLDEVSTKAAQVQDLGFYVTTDASQALSTLDEVSTKATQVQNVKVNVSVDDRNSVKILEDKIMASALRTRSAYLDTANAVYTIGVNARNAFANTDELIAFVEQVNKQFVIGGASAQGQAAAMLQLTQAMAAGALRGEELNSILENAPGIARAIEQYMGVAEGSIKSYAQEGLVTAETVKNALFNAADQTNAKFASMPQTWEQLWTYTQNLALSILDPILAKINRIINSDRFLTALQGLLSILSGVSAVAAKLLDLVTNVAAAFIDNWSWIAPIILGVAAAIGAVRLAQLLCSAVEWISTSAKIAHAIATGANTVAIGLETKTTNEAAMAQWGLNIAFLKSPVLWIALAVVALTAALISLVNWIAKTTGAAQSGFGIITGGINVILHAVGNLALFLANVALGIWNAFGAVCSNIGIAFHNVTSNVQSWFYSLLSTALNVVGKICEALNKLPFVEFDYSGITSKADEYAAKAQQTAVEPAEYVSISDAFQQGFGTFDAFAPGWEQKAFQEGAAWGDGVVDKIKGFFTPSDDPPDPGVDDPFYPDISDYLGQIADNTSSAADTLEVSGEELKYLRDIAERDAINRFTTAEVKIDMTGMTNRIENSNDLDGVIRELTDGFSDALATAAEGVYA